MAVIRKTKLPLCNRGPVDSVIFTFVFRNGTFWTICTVDIRDGLSIPNKDGCQCLTETETTVVVSATFAFSKSVMT